MRTRILLLFCVTTFNGEHNKIDRTAPQLTYAKRVSELSRLRFLSGDWSATFVTFEETWGESGAGRSTGTASAEFGPGDHWFEMVAETTLPESGPYAVRVVLYEGAQNGQIDAFVVNSFGSHAKYTGRFVNDSALVFRASFGAKIQQVRYEKRGNTIRYVAEDSFDGGTTFLPHTESTWQRAGRDLAPVQATSASQPPYAAYVGIPAET